jgi:hypothetical protein
MNAALRDLCERFNPPLDAIHAAIAAEYGGRCAAPVFSLIASRGTRRDIYHLPSGGVIVLDRFPTYGPAEFGHGVRRFKQVAVAVREIAEEMIAEEELPTVRG